VDVSLQPRDYSHSGDLYACKKEAFFSPRNDPKQRAQKSMSHYATMMSWNIPANARAQVYPRYLRDSSQACEWYVFYIFMIFLLSGKAHHTKNICCEYYACLSPDYSYTRKYIIIKLFL
jgi:hypothetical protein